MLAPQLQAWADQYEAEEKRLGIYKENSMGTVAKASSGTDFELPQAGAVVGRCYMVADLGTQDTTFKGTPKKSHKVLLQWELSETMQDGRPFAISSRYTLSLFDQALLRQHLESWRGRGFTEDELIGFDVKNVLGHYCMLSIVHNKDGDKTYANVKGIMPVPKGMEKPAPVNKDVYFDLDTSSLDILPEWVQNVVKKSDEWKARTGSNENKDLAAGNAAAQHAASGRFDDMADDIPF